MTFDEYKQAAWAAFQEHRSQRETNGKCNSCSAKKSCQGILDPTQLLIVRYTKAEEMAIARETLQLIDLGTSIGALTTEKAERLKRELEDHLIFIIVGRMPRDVITNEMLAALKEMQAGMDLISPMARA